MLSRLAADLTWTGLLALETILCPAFGIICINFSSASTLPMRYNAVLMWYIYWATDLDVIIDQFWLSIEPNTPTRKFSQPATISIQSKPTPPGLHLLRKLSMSGGSSSGPLGSPTLGSPTHALPSENEGLGCSGGEGLVYSSPTQFDNVPIIAEQTNSPSQYAQGRFFSCMQSGCIRIMQECYVVDIS